jgi:hypothetical protein
MKSIADRIGGAVLLALLCAPAVCAAERVIIFTNSMHEVAPFRAFAKAAARMKRYGRVQIDIGVLAAKADFELPPGGNDWHQYAVFNASLSKFFPHPKIAPFRPAPWVAKNRELLLAKAAILREFGLEAALSSNDTHYLPEAFFERYPQLRGPRVDHPRRSKREEFSFCVDQPETREMIEWMTAEAVRNVPEIKTILVHLNDSGTGLCWADNQYSGPNGPQFCRHRSAGLRLRDMAEAMQRGAAKAGGEIDVRIGGQFSNAELDDIARHLPPRTFLSGRDPLVVGGHGVSDRDPSAVGAATAVLETYPVMGMLNPLAVLAGMEGYPQARTLVLGTSLPWYYRADEPLETVNRLIDIVETAIASPARGLMPRFRRLQELAARWGGEANADRIFEGFYRLDEALRQRAQVHRYSTLYAGVSTRHITRPLLLRPEVLGPADEARFLPFIFNISEVEARRDYVDVHGGRISRFWDDAAYPRFSAAALQAAAIFENARNAPEERWFAQLARSIRMWVSVMQSVRNFVHAQRIRDARQKDLAAPAPAHFKDAGSAGDPDNFRWYQIQRDELDNTAGLIRLLKDGGLAFFAHAKDARDEDTFLLGPDVIETLTAKRRLMREHWYDGQRYFAPPHK